MRGYSCCEQVMQKAAEIQDAIAEGVRFDEHRSLAWSGIF